MTRALFPDKTWSDAAVNVPSRSPITNVTLLPR